nr:uncharacterized protein LOC116155400 [Camelus dromedarius]XP_031316245.1 uncharacterized protein LOC116155400 [Camelus dromedarius]XP_031316246.1 uncharacterized protein LOC116155400 [Camelus dromedarius]
MSDGNVNINAVDHRKSELGGTLEIMSSVWAEALLFRNRRQAFPESGLRLSSRICCQGLVLREQLLANGAIAITLALNDTAEITIIQPDPTYTRNRPAETSRLETGVLCFAHGKRGALGSGLQLTREDLMEDSTPQREEVGAASCPPGGGRGSRTFWCCLTPPHRPPHKDSKRPGACSSLTTGRRSLPTTNNRLQAFPSLCGSPSHGAQCPLYYAETIV